MSAQSRDRTRGRLRLTRTRALMLGGGAALSAALLSAFSIAGLTGTDVAQAAVAKARSFVDLMHQRSPGERTEAQLVKKRRPISRVLAERGLPDVPALAPYQPAQPFFPAVAIPEAVPILAEKLPTLAYAAPPTAFFIPPPGGVFIGPPGGGGGGPGGGGGGPGGSTPGTPGQQPPPEIPPAVPEPSSWALLIAGFGLTGWSLRQKAGARAQEWPQG